jgi:signal transduction histidine kinase
MKYSYSLVVVAAAIALEFRLDEGAELLLMLIIFSVIGAMFAHSIYVAKKTDERLKEAYRQTALATGVKSDFLAVMSHELRTPLTAVMGFAELLIDGCAGKTTPEQSEMLQRIDESSKHLLSLIQQVLDISMAEKGQLDLQIERCDVSDLIIRTVSIMDPIAKKKGLTVHVNVPRQRCLADTDIGKLRQVVVNLVGNSIKFTKVGSITVELDCSNSHFRLRVRDTGIGIREEDYEQVFEPFYQGEGTIYNRSREGAGLGLTISREIVLLMQGTIECDSKLGEGSTFSVRIPRLLDVAMAS